MKVWELVEILSEAGVHFYIYDGEKTKHTLEEDVYDVDIWTAAWKKERDETR